MANVSDIIQYYVNLLIIQYSGLPKATATINLFATTMLASGIALDVQGAYNVNTAVGVQLDVIGKYVGVDRHYSQLALINYFSLITYSEVAAPPSSPPRWGFETYATFGENNLNGTLTYGGIIDSTNALSDDDFRILIKFMIAVNTSNFSRSDIDNEVFNAFGSAVRAEGNGNMGIVYFFQAPISALLFAVIFKKLLPKPMGVSATIVQNVGAMMFGLTDYTGYQSPYAYGFSTYANYGTLAGQVLQYNQMSGQ